MILLPAICNSISPARSQTSNESRNESTLALQFSGGQSFYERTRLKRDDTNLELDAILRRATAQTPGPPTAECADPEMLAAYYDRSLGEADRERLEAHFTDCARCQAQLAAIARADEAASSARPRLGVSRLRPLIVVPALAAAAALLLVVRSMRTSIDESRGARQAAMAKNEAPLADLAARAPAPISPPAAATAPGAPASSELAMNEAKRAAPSAIEHRRAPERRDELSEHTKKPQLPKSEGDVIASAPSHSASADLANTEAAPAPGPPPISKSAQTGVVSAPEPASEAQTVTAPAPEAASAAPAPYAMSENAATAPRALAKSVSSFAAQNGGASETSSAAPVGGAVAGAAIGGGVAAAQSQLQQATSASAATGVGSATGAIVGSAKARSVAPAEVLAMISPPDQSAGWQVGKNGMIVRRDPDGSTHPQHSGVTTDLTAGAAPSSTVCWIVGRSGTIIRTTDGEHWDLITAPTGDNLVAVASDSADHAVVTTASGRNFATSDGGSTWHRQ